MHLYGFMLQRLNFDGVEKQIDDHPCNTTIRGIAVIKALGNLNHRLDRRWNGSYTFLGHKGLGM